MISNLQSIEDKVQHEGDVPLPQKLLHSHHAGVEILR